MYNLSEPIYCWNSFREQSINQWHFPTCVSKFKIWKWNIECQKLNHVYGVDESNRRIPRPLSFKWVRNMGEKTHHFRVITIMGKLWLSFLSIRFSCSLALVVIFMINPPPVWHLAGQISDSISTLWHPLKPNHFDSQCASEMQKSSLQLSLDWWMETPEGKYSCAPLLGISCSWLFMMRTLMFSILHVVLVFIQCLDPSIICHTCLPCNS